MAFIESSLCVVASSLPKREAKTWDWKLSHLLEIWPFIGNFPPKREEKIWPSFYWTFMREVCFNVLLAKIVTALVSNI